MRDIVRPDPSKVIRFSGDSMNFRRILSLHSNWNQNLRLSQSDFEAGQDTEIKIK